MMRYVTYLIFTLLLAGFFSCAKKKYPESVIENEPVYYSKFDVNGKTIEFKAAGENFYMYADVTKDTADVNQHTSTFRRTDCESCGPSLRFVIRDYATSKGGQATLIDSTIRKGTYEYLGPVAGTKYVVNFIATQTGNGTASSILWDFGDGTKATGNNVSHTFNNTGINNVCVSLKTNNGCVSNMCNQHHLVSNGLNCSLTASADSATRVRFTASVTGGTAPYNYFWEFGDGKNTKGLASMNHLYAVNGSYLTRLTVTDALGNQLVTQYNAITASDPSSCGINFNRGQTTAVSGIEQTLSKVGIVFTDEQGVSYQTLGNTQPSTSYFEILDVREGEINENGRPTKIVSLKFNCEVSNGSQKLILNNGMSSISIAY